MSSVSFVAVFEPCFGQHLKDWETHFRNPGGPAPEKAGKFAVFQRGLTPRIPFLNHFYGWNLRGPASAFVNRTFLLTHNMNRVTMILEHLGPSTMTKGRALHGPSKYFEHFVDLSWVYVWSVNLTKPLASWILALSFFSPACPRKGARNLTEIKLLNMSQLLNKTLFAHLSCQFLEEIHLSRLVGIDIVFRFSLQASLH